MSRRAKIKRNEPEYKQSGSIVVDQLIKRLSFFLPLRVLALASAVLSFFLGVVQSKSLPNKRNGNAGSRARASLELVKSKIVSQSYETDNKLYVLGK